jgi:predicted amidophosphoribosyltransferase
MKCPACGNNIDQERFSADLAFCPFCGQDVKAAAAKSRLSFCPYCGQKLNEMTNFCPNCGKKLASQQFQPDKSPAAERSLAESFIERTAKPFVKSIRNSFGRERQMRKLYKQWAEFSDLPQDAIPSADDLHNMAASQRESRYDEEDED